MAVDTGHSDVHQYDVRENFRNFCERRICTAVRAHAEKLASLFHSLPHHPEVILAGRRINDGMGRRIARECIRGLLRRKGSGGMVTILGITFKENVPDTRNSRVIDIVRELRDFGITVQIADPVANAEAVAHEYDMTLTDLEALQPADAVILAVAHDRYVGGGWPLIQRLLQGGAGLVLDIKMKLDRSSQPAGIELWRL